MKDIFVIVIILLNGIKLQGQSVDSFQYHIQKPIEKLLISEALDLKIKTSESLIIITLQNGVNKVSVNSIDSVISSIEDKLKMEYLKSNYYFKRLKECKIIIVLKVLSYVDNYVIQYKPKEVLPLENLPLFIKDGDSVVVRTVYINIGLPIR